MAIADKTKTKKFLLALPDNLRAALEREAFIHHRSLTAEVVVRLERSVDAQPKPIAAYSQHSRATVVHTNESMPGDLSDADAAMLRLFRAMPPEKQLALLSLFK